MISFARVNVAPNVTLQMPENYSRESVEVYKVVFSSDISGEFHFDTSLHWLIMIRPAVTTVEYKVVLIVRTD